MNKFKHLLALTVFIFGISLVAMPVTHAKGVQFDMLSATPVGSWQLREDVSTDSRGRKTVMSAKTSLLAKEKRNGQDYYWIEVVMENYKVSKKGKRKKKGDNIVMKTLVSKSALAGDPANLMTNMRGFGEEMIMQNGKSDPIRISGSGGMAGAMMQSMGTEVNFDFQQLGSETVTVPAGEFSAIKVQGSGQTKTKVVFKTISVSSDTTAWMSKKVPFGIVKSEGSSVVNGKSSTHTSTLKEYGTSGAVSLITKEPQELPGMGNIFGR